MNSCTKTERTHRRTGVDTKRCQTQVKPSEQVDLESARVCPLHKHAFSSTVVLVTLI